MTTGPTFGVSGSPEVSAALAQIGEQITRPGPPYGFSVQASAAFLVIHASYGGDLGTEAIKLAKHSRSDQVSQYHVEEADARLRVPPNMWLSTVFNTFGGVLAGIGLPVLFTVFTTGEETSLSAVGGALALTVVAAPLLTLGMVKAKGR